MTRATPLNAGPSPVAASATTPTSPGFRSSGAPRAAARHPIESISPAGLVLVTLLMASAGVALAAMLKVFSMLRMVLA